MTLCKNVCVTDLKKHARRLNCIKNIKHTMYKNAKEISIVLMECSLFSKEFSKLIQCKVHMIKKN